jgi:hypothetical protein
LATDGSPAPRRRFATRAHPQPVPARRIARRWDHAQRWRAINYNVGRPESCRRR